MQTLGDYEIRNYWLVEPVEFAPSVPRADVSLRSYAQSFVEWGRRKLQNTPNEFSGRRRQCIAAAVLHGSAGLYPLTQQIAGRDEHY